MTRKFLHSHKKPNGKKARNEFLIPDIFENTSRLIGIETGISYNYGLVCYTGVDLNADIVFDKATKYRKITILRRRAVKKMLTNYLAQIKEIKISKAVVIDDNYNLIEIKIAEK